MKVITVFIKDLKKYFPYSVRAGKAELKAEIAGSYLSFLWWILDPLLFMLVYTFVSLVVFGKAEEYFSAFIFVGYTSFKLFERTMKTSVRLISGNKSIVKNIYVPKIILMFSKLYVNFFKFVISFLLVFIAMALYQVPLTWKVFLFIPLVILLVILSLGVGLFLLHAGVYVQDLSNVIHIALRLLFYMSGIFYDIGGKRLADSPVLQQILLTCNPIAFIVDQMRKVLLYDGTFNCPVYFAWLAAAIIIFLLGLRTVYKNENSYVKVI